MKVTSLVYEGGKIVKYGMFVEGKDVILDRDEAIKLIENKGCDNAEVRSRKGTKFITGKGCNLTDLNKGIDVGNSVKNSNRSTASNINNVNSYAAILDLNKKVMSASKININQDSSVKGKILNVVDVSAAMRVYHHNTKMANLSWKIDGIEYPTKAMYGLFQLFKRFDKGSKHVFCADRRSVRKDISDDYKKGRPAASDEYYMQLREVERILTDCGMNLLYEEGMEADDFISSVVLKYHNNFDRINIWTNDRDLCYLVDSKVIYRSLINNLPDISVANYEKVLKIPYNTMTLFKATVGDTSDNIPGVKQFGHKAFEMLLEFATKVGFSSERISNNEEAILRMFFKADDNLLEQALTSLSLVRPFIRDVKIEDNEDFVMLKQEVLRYGMKSVASCL